MSVEMWINICQLLLQPHITVFLSFRVKQGWWKSMSFALHVSAMCKAILAPAVWFIIGASWNAFELCLLEPIQSWCNCVHIDAYGHRDLSTCSFGSWAHKEASALHSQQQDLQLTGCTKFQVFFHRIPYAMHHYALTLWIEHFSLWNPVFPLFCDLNPLQRSIFHDKNSLTIQLITKSQNTSWPTPTFTLTSHWTHSGPCIHWTLIVHKLSPLHQWLQIALRR